MIVKPLSSDGEALNQSTEDDAEPPVEVATDNAAGK